MELDHTQQFRGLGYGNLVFWDGVERGESGLFFLIQRYILGEDIFSD